jgi:hypothetical protein
MAVIKSELINERSELVDRQKRYYATFKITTDSRGMTCKAAYAAAQSATPHPVPAPYSTYSLLGDTDVNAFCQTIKPKRKSEKDATHIVVDVEWFPIVGDPANAFTSEDNPLAVPIERWVEWEDIQVPADEAWNEEELPGIGRNADTLGPIQDAAGGEPSAPIMKTKKIPVLCLQKNYATLGEITALALTFADALNSATFYGAPERTALYRGAEISRPQYAGGTTYHTAVHRVAFLGGGWSFAMVNRGWAYLESGNLVQATIKDQDDNDVPVTSPINLQLDGTRTPDGQIGTIIHYRTSPKLAFSGLGIGGGA